jgi:DNA-binding NarL/FixJ family response regulator
VTTSPRPRVLLADDHAGILDAFQRLLGDACEVVGRVSSNDALVDAAARCQPDVIIADMSMPGRDGLEAFRQIRQDMPNTKIVVATAADDPAAKSKALQAGACEVVPKFMAAMELLPAIRRAMEG